MVASCCDFDVFSYVWICFCIFDSFILVFFEYVNKKQKNDNDGQDI